MPPLGEYGTVDFVDTAAGYLFDMHAHFDVFLRQHPNNKVWDVDAESIYSRQGIEHLLRSMGFGVNDKCVQSLLNVGTSNDHVNWQKPELLELREEVFLARLYNVAHKFDKYGYKFAEADYMLKKVMCLESVNGMCRQPLVKFSYKQMEQLLNVTIPGNGFPPVSDVSRQNDEAIKKSKK
ncbi:MAG: hypothetical protein EOO65_03970 [Methanosarcinales archaeon]|nr:MAG: hypothetical protein EOO65_03970 [Methanosarcinales archaeon]